MGKIELENPYETDKKYVDEADLIDELIKTMGK